MKNIDKKTVISFGEEWSRFDQKHLDESEGVKIFKEYFSIFPMDFMNQDATGFDMGCGTGRWAKYVAPNVKHLNCIDPSSAINIAKDQLKGYTNISYFKNSVDDYCLDSNSQDFGYSLGVLHHIPDTQQAISSCVNLLKPGAPLLLYLYYAFDDRPLWFKAIWRLSNVLRRIVCNLPEKFKYLTTDLIALLIYFPLARVTKLLTFFEMNISNIPLSYYRNHSFYTMRTDARDRFGTPLEQRFTKKAIRSMMLEAGLKDIVFSESEPFWCVLGYKQK